jgi:HAD superfamily hydrolase (TIGR01509 family)
MTNLQQTQWSGIIFDLDNTLVSSSLNYDRIRTEIDCPMEQDILEFVDTLTAVEKKLAIQVVIQHEIEDAMSAIKLSGVDRLLSLLATHDVPSAIVTRNCQVAAKIKLDNLQINIDLLLTREDHKAKPAPDGLLHIAKLWNAEPQNILYVGDYLYDIQAANNAKMKSCLLSFGRQLHFSDLANVVVHDLVELTELLANSLIAKTPKNLLKD